MTTKELKEFAKVLEAYAEGKDIQCRWKSEGEMDKWTDVTRDWHFENNLDKIEYRIKPTFILKPFSTPEEFFQAQKHHGMVIKDNNDCYYNIASFNKDGIFLAINRAYDYQYIVKNFFWADDGTPCGIYKYE